MMEYGTRGIIVTTCINPDMHVKLENKIVHQAAVAINDETIMLLHCKCVNSAKVNTVIQKEGHMCIIWGTEIIRYSYVAQVKK